MLVEKLRCVVHSHQAVLVTTRDYRQYDARLETFEKFQGRWQRVFAPIKADIGRYGFVCSKVEGDRKSPIGVYTFGTAFGRGENPNTRLPYRQTTENDFWVDDPESVFYNSWQVGPACGRWKSAESLCPQGKHYNYAVVINYNTQEKIPCMGSAVFLHVWTGAGIGTDGCVAVDQDRLLEIIRWLDPLKKPLLIMGPVFEVINW